MKRAPPRGLVLLVFALLVAARVYGAWVQRFNLDADRGVVQLMAKHVAEGRAWPVFFYGQGYMGSLEPLLSGLICKGFGVSAFHVGLGTALVAVGLAGIVWRIARAIAGPWAALYAVAYLVTGSPAYNFYMGNPRGGYAVVLLLGWTCLYLSARLASRAFRGERSGYAGYAGLGLVAGAAWWTSAIAISALAAAAVIVAIGQRGRILNLRNAAGLAGFFVGAAPWLVWNVRHDWISLSMGGSVGATKLAQSMPWLLSRLVDLVGLGRPEVGSSVIGAALIAFVLIAVARPLRAALRQRELEPIFQGAALGLFCAFFIALYASSSFSRTETLRYLLPLVPLFAVLVGLACANWTGRLPLAAHVALLVALMGVQVVQGKFRLKPDEAVRARFQSVPDWSAWVRAQGIDAVMAWFGLHWINFASGEAVPVVDVRGERYAGYARAGLLADHPAWLENPENLQSFLNLTASSYRAEATPLGFLLYDVQPPRRDWKWIEREQVSAITDQSGADVTQPLLDRSLATCWTGRSTSQSPAAWHIKLAQPTAVRGLKLYSPDTRYPLYVAVDVRGSADESWREVIAPRFATGYHWSGPRPYWQNLYHALEIRIDSAPVREVRLRFPPAAKRPFYAMRMAEVALLVADAEADAEPYRPRSSEVDDLIRFLQARGMNRVLADRWVSDRIAARTGHTLRVRGSAELFRGVNDPPQNDVPVYTRADLGVGCALLLPRGTAPTVEQQLRELGFHPERCATPLGVLLLINDPADADVLYRGPMAWFGDALFALYEPGDTRFLAHHLFQKAESLLPDSPEGVQSLLEQCLALDPEHVPALRRWLEVAAPDHPDRAERAQALRRLTEPEHRSRVRFGNGVVLEGCTVEPAQAAPGQVVTVTYFWRIPPAFSRDGVSVFAHFRQNGVVWQDDHPLFDGVSPLRLQEGSSVAPLREVRQVTIPTNAPLGTYDVAIGLVQADKPGKRHFAWGPQVGWDFSARFRQPLTVVPP